MATSIEISTQVLDVEAIVRSVTAASTCAVSAFVGTTPDKIECEAYEPMARKKLTKVCANARERWNVHHVAVHVRLGVMEASEANVVVAISSEHRRDSLEAVAFVADEMKARVPIWTKEVYDDGESSWEEDAEWAWSASALAPIEVDSSEIQVNAPTAELERRMKALMRRKRRELDSSNVQEFCNRHVSDKREFSCARTDSVLGERDSHQRQSSVVSPYGPQEEKALRNEPLSEAVNGRLAELEAKLLPRDEQAAVEADVYARLRALEDRVAFLEGASPEYVIFDWLTVCD